MQPSPLQVLDLKFIKVRIEPREKPRFDKPGQVFERHSFDNTSFVNTIEHSPANDDPNSPVLNFVVSLELELPNSGENPPPYIVEVKCVGYFNILKSISDDPVKRYDIAVVNGTSILYGALRELVSSVTSRAWYGPLILPTVSFQDDAPSNGQHVSFSIEDEEPDTLTKKARRSKKKSSD